MVTALIRTVILYITVVLSLRFMGKRQIGQMELSEFVTAVMLSELAVFPITNTDAPLLYGIIPIIFLICLEVIVSFATLKCSPLQKFIDGKPAVLISKGVINQQNLKKTRVTLKELLTQLRSTGISSIDEVDYVFLEPNGKFSIIQKKAQRAVSCDDLNIPCENNGIDHAIIIDGEINTEGLALAGKDKNWLYKKLKDEKVKQLSDVLYFCADDLGKTHIIIKEKSK